MCTCVKLKTINFRFKTIHWKRMFLCVSRVILLILHWGRTRRWILNSADDECSVLSSTLLVTTKHSSKSSRYRVFFELFSIAKNKKVACSTAICDWTWALQINYVKQITLENNNFESQYSRPVLKVHTLQRMWTQ